MCGIIGYAGKSEALPYLLKGLEQLEYRGYDSAGVAVLGQGSPYLMKSVGSTVNLKARIGSSPVSGTVGIGHTRWATHGSPSERNAHPQWVGPLYIVHNGIVENERSLRESLEEEGEVFSSDTDTETIVRLVYREMRRGLAFPDSVQAVLCILEGSYSFLMAHEDPEQPLIAVHRGAPLLLGACPHGVFVASDMTAFPVEVQSTLPLESDDLVTIRPDGQFEIISLRNGQGRMANLISRSHHGVHGKGEYPHFMFKEICEQPEMVDRILSGRILRIEGSLQIVFPLEVENVLSRAKRIRIVGCGTSYHAGLLAKHRIEFLAGIPVEVDIASEFRYRDPLLDPDSDLLIALTQSGETADTLASLRMARELGVPTLVLVNVPGSTADREADASLFLDAGPEFGVAATKTFLSQITLLTLIALYLSDDLRLESKGLPVREALLSEFLRLPMLLDKTLSLSTGINAVAVEMLESVSALFMGRGGDFPLALEGALKLKEITYIHAEGYAGGELKHGPLALVEQGTPVVAIISPDSALVPKMVSNMKEVQSRGAFIIAISSDSVEDEIAPVSSLSLFLPDIHPFLFPLISSIPLQLLAYHTACLKGLDVDRPRNLAKSVTVE
ncbi:MAG: glutamine--fructose-6-phosphate transaminase (isomerizing) [Leptospirales bacterium]